MSDLIALPAFQDNYIWVLEHKQQAVVIDPGSAEVVRNWLAEHQRQLVAILLTHHHRDHTAGVAALRAQTGAVVYGGASEMWPMDMGKLDHPCHHAQRFTLLDMTFQVLHVPGHTLGHMAYLATANNSAPMLFSGDTLFSAGCGRLFEGTATQMLASLDTLSPLPDDTLVCAAHEYTLSNLRFAQAVEPHNLAVAEHLLWCEEEREQDLPSLPSTLAIERAINPFLRIREPDVINSVQQRAPEANTDVERFAALRAWKNVF